MDGSLNVEGEDTSGGTPRANDSNDVDHGDGDDTWWTRTRMICGGQGRGRLKGPNGYRGDEEPNKKFYNNT